MIALRLSSKLVNLSITNANVFTNVVEQSVGKVIAKYTPVIGFFAILHRNGWKINYIEVNSILEQAIILNTDLGVLILVLWGATLIPSNVNNI